MVFFPRCVHTGVTFMNVKVFNLYAPCYQNSTVPQCYRKNELEKKRKYEERILEIEHGSLFPAVFSAAGDMGTIATVVYKRLASLLAEKEGRPYCSALHWLRSVIMCIRGSWSIFFPLSLLHNPRSPSTWASMTARCQHFETILQLNIF